MAKFLKTVIFILNLLKYTVCAGNSLTRKDYCNIESCYGAQHIACGNSGKPSCIGFSAIQFNEKQVKVALDKHNELRNKIACDNNIDGANGGTFPTASDMCFMNWDNELAYLASLNVLQCTMRHDSCRDVDRFYVGQNLFKQSTTGKLESTEVIIETGIQAWFDEHTDCPVTMVENLETQSVPVIGHFTQVIRGESALIGCAAATYPDGSYTTILLCCNYQFGNMLGEPIYAAGEPCSACPNQLACNKEYKGLCGSQKQISIDYPSGSQNPGSANERLLVIILLIFFVQDFVF